MIEKAQEPWFVDLSGTEPCIRDANREFFGIGYSSDEGSMAGREHILKRITACVNFLQGIPTEDLELLQTKEHFSNAFNEILDAIEAAKGYPGHTKEPT